MKPTKEQIADWIDEYLQSPNAVKVMNRKWEMMFIHRLHKENYAGYNEKASDRWKRTIETRCETLNKHTSFDELYKAVKGITEHGIGELSKYDTATCLGCERRIYPTVVYLHAGTAEGARALGVTGVAANKEQFVEICKAFGKLEPIQIEDFLCIYKYCLQGNAIQCAKVRARMKNNKACGAQPKGKCGRGC